MGSSRNQPRSEIGQLVYLAIARDGNTLNCEPIVANISEWRRVLSLGSSVLDPGTGAILTSETLAEGEEASFHKTGRVPVCFLSSACRKVLVAPKKARGSNAVDVELGIALMSITQPRRQDDPGTEFPVHQNASMVSVAKSKKSKRARHGRAILARMKSMAKSKKSKRAKHGRENLAKADSSGSQSAAESEDSSGGEELGGELSEALKEMARLSQAGKAGSKQAQKQQKKKPSEKKEKKSKRKQKEKRVYLSELLGKDRPGKKGRGRGRGKGRKAEKE